jgi:hypothetical protein
MKLNRVNITRISASLFEYESSLHFKQTYIIYLLQGAPGPPGPIGVNGEVGFKVFLSLFYQSNLFNTSSMIKSSVYSIMQYLYIKMVLYNIIITHINGS